MKHRDCEFERSEKEWNELTYAVIGAAIAVHRALGPGFLESVYQGAMELELATRGLRFDRQLRVPIVYRSEVVGEHVVDLLVDGELVVELKAVEAFVPVHYAQLHSYLKACACEVGLLINFNVPSLRAGVRRIVLNTSAEGAEKGS